MVMRPVGPLSPGVYWFRRLLVVVAVVIVLALLWWLFRGGDDANPASADDQPTASETATAPTPTATESKTKSKTTRSETSPADEPPCADKDIEVSVTTDEQNYSSDEQPTFTLAVENVSSQACRRDVGQSALELRVSSGGELVWSSDHCSPGGNALERDFAPGDRFVQPVQWSRSTSEAGCPTPAEAAPPGDYQVVARNLEIISEPAVFTLAS